MYFVNRLYTYVKFREMLNSEDEENRKIFEHFIVAGLNENPEELTLLEHECGNKPNEALAPITDITVIFPGYGEKVSHIFLHLLLTIPYFRFLLVSFALKQHLPDILLT